MKSRTLCTCAVAVLFIATVASGEIVWDGDYSDDQYGQGSGSATYDYTTTTGDADGGDNYGWGYGEGWQSYYTTVGAYCNWEYEVYVWAEAELTLWDGQLCDAGAEAHASVSCPIDGGGSLSADAYVVDSGYEGYNPYDQDDGGEPQGLHGSGTNYFGANDGLSGEHTAGAVAFVPYGSQNTGLCHGDARAQCGLWYD
jgi:hypothetical protein